MRHLSLIAAVLIALSACTGQSASSSSNQSNADRSNASTSSGASQSDKSSSTASTDIPEYPGASTEAAGSGSNMGETASGKVLSTADSFDKVYGWYQQHMPSGSEKSHTTAPVDMAVFMIGDVGSGQKSVTITTQAGKTMITIANVKS